MTGQQRSDAARTLAFALGLIAVTANSAPLAFGGVGGGGGQSRTYTTDADFEEGILSNVNHDVADQLQLDVIPVATELSFVNIACSDRGTIVRIDALTGQILGEYQTAPNRLSKNPSRTSVDDFGNVWVGNRAEIGGGQGSVVKIGIVVGGTRVDANGVPNPTGQYLAPPYQYSTAVDRNGDGLIRTSRGLGNVLSWPNVTDGAGGADGIVQDAQDECILIFQRTSGIQVRTVACDANNDVWVAGYPFFPTSFDKLNGVNGALLTSFVAPGCGGNGGLVDQSGILWSDSHLENTILRYDPVSTASSCIPVVNSSGFPSLPHGIAVDNNGFIWVCQFNDNEVSKYDPAGNLVAGFPLPSGGASLDRSLAVTPIDNDIWVGNSAGNDVTRLDNNGVIRKVIPLGGNGISPRGVSVDGNGKVWVANFGSDNAMRIDPNGDLDGLGAVDMAVDVGSNAAPENYSDFTGTVPLEVLQPDGSWTVVYDSGSADTEYGVISYTSEEPSGTSLVVEFRVANTQGELAALRFQPVANGVAFSGVFGRFVEVRVSFLRASPQTLASPILFDLTIESLGGGGPETDCPPPGHPNPGSLLVFPEFDNRSNSVTMLAVTNVNEDHGFESPGLENGTVDVEFVYIQHRGVYGELLDCIEFNRTHRLTPNDTLAVLTRFHNPQASQGYVYVFAKDPTSHEAIVHNSLIGNTFVFSGIDAIDYSYNPFVYLGVGDEGSTTDDDGDGIRDLNGFEYCPSSDETLIPRFLGQRAGIQSDLVVINLTGGPQFTALIDFLIYNDNEEVFSSQLNVRCWDKRPLLSISNSFSQNFLALATNDAPNEIFGASSVESGWFRMNGRSASSGVFTIQDPAFLAVLIENVSGFAGASLPFEIGQQDNGDLLPDGPFGDSSK
jgi:streptogramin lyase